MKRFALFLFRLSFDFIDNKHVEDFLAWDNLYRAKRSVDRKRSQTQKVNKQAQE